MYIYRLHHVHNAQAFSQIIIVALKIYTLSPLEIYAPSSSSSLEQAFTLFRCLGEAIHVRIVFF